MVHFTCDLCGKDMAASGDPRFVVKVEVTPGLDSPGGVREADLDDDAMEAVADLIRRDEHLSSDEVAALAPRGFRFDLCPGCHAKFLRDPLGREVARSFDFSQN